MVANPAWRVYWVLLAGAIVYIYWYTRRRADARDALLRDARRLPVRALGPGLTVRVIGRVVADQPLVAPIGGQPCVYFELFAHKQLSDSKRIDTFSIDDGTGSIDVVANEAEIACDGADTLAPRPGGGFDEQATIAVGARVAVFGDVELEPASDAGSTPFREAPRRLRLRARFISNDPAFWS